MATLLTLVWILHLFMRDTACMSVQETQNFISVTLGEKIVLNCSVRDGQTERVFWYKQSFGMTPTVITNFKVSEERGEIHRQFGNNRRFQLDNTDGKNDLEISQVKQSDSGVYHCIRLFQSKIIFWKSVTVMVKDLVSVQQTALAVTEQGSSVNLKCVVHIASCEGQPRVHWFRQSNESAAGVLHSNERCEKTPKALTHSCVYSLPIHNVNSGQTGTYYCVVAACGQVLLGNGTKLSVEDGGGYSEYVLSGALVLSCALTLGLAFSLYILKKKYNSLCAVMERAGVTMSTGPNGEDQDVDSLQYATVKINPPAKQREAESTDCVYSTVQPH